MPVDVSIHSNSSSQLGPTSGRLAITENAYDEVIDVISPKEYCEQLVCSLTIVGTFVNLGM